MKCLLVKIASVLAVLAFWPAQVLSQTQTSKANAESENSVSSQSQRVALVIGNSAYPSRPLKNTLNDVRDVAKSLKLVGFDVVYRENLSIRGIGSALREFKSKLRKGSVALFYYAGHGVQLRGENYFLATDALVEHEEDLPNQSLSLKQLMEVLEESKAELSLLFLDACRDNPFSLRSRSVGRGLASVNAPSGVLISYSTRPGAVADDGVGRNGVYTGELLNFLHSKLPIEQVVKKVTMNVKQLTRGRQEPWSEGSISGDFCFAGCEGLEETQARLQLEAEQWLNVRSSQKPEDFVRFMEMFPNGIFVKLAAALKEKLVLQIQDQDIRELEKSRLAKLREELRVNEEQQQVREDAAKRIAKAQEEKEKTRAAESARLATMQKEDKLRGEQQRARDDEAARLAKLKEEEDGRRIRESENSRLAKLRQELAQRQEGERIREDEATRLSKAKEELILTEEKRIRNTEAERLKKLKIVIFAN